MLLVDDLLMAPGKAVVALFEQLAKRAQEEFLDDAVVKQELHEIHALIEAGRISETEFETREGRLLERLEQITRAKLQGGWAGLAALPAPTEADIADIVAFAREQAPPAIDTVAIPRALAPTVLDTVAVSTVPVVRDVAPPPPDPLAVVAAAAPAFSLPPAVSGPAPAQQSAPGPSMPVYPPAVPVYPTVAPPVLPAAPAFLPPPAVSELPVQTAAPALAPSAPSRVTMPQAVESAIRGLAMLKMKVSSVTCVVPSGEGWQVTVELVERRGVPDTSDLLGVYESFLDAAGNVLRYERTRIRRRCDVGG